MTGSIMIFFSSCEAIRNIVEEHQLLQVLP